VIWLLTQCFKLISFFTYIDDNDDDDDESLRADTRRRDRTSKADRNLNELRPMHRVTVT